MVTPIYPTITLGIISYPKTEERLLSLIRLLESLKHVQDLPVFEVLISFEDCEISRQQSTRVWVERVVRRVFGNSTYYFRVVFHKNPRGVGQNMAHLSHHSSGTYLMLMEDDMEFTKEVSILHALNILHQRPIAALFLDQSQPHISKWKFNEYDPFQKSYPDPYNHLRYRQLTVESNYFYSNAVHIRSPLFSEEIGINTPNYHHEWALNEVAKFAASESRIQIWGLDGDIIQHHPEPPVREHKNTELLNNS